MRKEKLMNRAYSRLKQRLESAEAWTENFLDVERHREISKKAIKELWQKRPLISFIFHIIYLPTKALHYFSKLYWWNEYYKCCKEIDIIKKELKNYE